MGIIEALIEFQREHGYGPSMEELGEMVGRDKATISEAVQRMARDGLIEVERADGNNVLPRTIRIKVNNVQHLSPCLTVGVVKQPGEEYLHVGPRGLLLTPEEQIGLLYYLRDRWNPDNPVLDEETIAKLRKGYKDPEAIRREIMAPWPENVYIDPVGDNA